MINLRHPIPIAGLLSLLLIAVPHAPSAGPARPNIVFILADDLGYGEVGCYGQTRIKTPNIDRLAQGGIRFLQHYTGAPVCAPARGVLMTGQHLAHAEIRNNRDSGNGRVFPGQWPLSSQAITIAQALKKAGYATGAFGKWGLGPSNSSGSPIKQGFDRYFGYNCQRNAHSYYPYFLDSNETEIVVNNGLVPGHQRKLAGEVDANDYRLRNYAPDLILKEALKFIDQNKSKPFFLYLPFVEPHVALQSPQEWIDRYPEEWDRENGPYRGENSYLPHPQPRAAYAAMISDLDEHVGTVIDTLARHGLTGNTIVIFTSDNGTTHPGRDPKFHTGGADPAFFNSTANLRGWKGSVYEGGIRVPCVVNWPGQIRPGSTTDLPSYFPDWFPTLCEIGGAALPENHRLDGISLASVLKGKAAPHRKEPLIWEFQGYTGLLAIRDGKWKAVRRGLAQNPAAWELYNLDEDSGEQQDLAAAHPAIIQRLESAYLATRTLEPDFPNPTYDPLTQP